MSDEWAEILEKFKVISSIPRCSGNEKQVSNYISGFAKARGCEVIQDETFNLVVKKKGTPGYERSPVVVLQGHLDMVCVKRSDSNHDFQKDPIKVVVVGSEHITADGTSLGADNGIAVAYLMTLIESSEIAHPPLELLFTASEECGMVGASKIKPGVLKGRSLINLDMEYEGIFLVSCAGGLTNIVRSRVSWVKNSGNKQAYLLKINGLQGGHSGLDIDKGRANAIKLMGELLHALSMNAAFDLVNISGGMFFNAIPTEAQATLLVGNENADVLKKDIKAKGNAFKVTFEKTDPGMEITFEAAPGNFGQVMSDYSKKSIISMLKFIPNGVQSMSQDMEGLVQTSTNIGVMGVSEDEFSATSCIRRSNADMKRQIIEKIDTVVRDFGAEAENKDDYPEWEYKKESPLRDLCKRVYEELFNQQTFNIAVHAGVECGL